MPFKLKLNPKDPWIEITTGDDPALKLKDLLEVFGKMDSSAGKLSEQSKAFSGLKGNIIAAVQRDAKGNDALLALVRDCWNLICDKYNGVDKPLKAGTDYELPVPAPPRAAVKSTTTAIAKPSGVDYENWKRVNSVQVAWFKVFEKDLTHEPADEAKLSEQEWEAVVDSVWLLGKSFPEFLNFFATIYNLDVAYRSDPSLALPLTKIRIRSLLRNLIPSSAKGRKDKSIGGYKGACCEIEDMFRTGVLRKGDVTRIAIPKANKKFDDGDLSGMTLKKDKDKLREQDIDRTEVYHGDTKFYVEVKSDVHTAVQKHSKFPSDQLTRILAVIANRNKKDLASSKPKYGKRHPAVSIVNASQWLEIFTTRTGRNYYKLGFWLFIEGQMFSPAEVQTIDERVWRDASGSKPYPDPIDNKALEDLKVFFAAHKDSYGPIASKL